MAGDHSGYTYHATNDFVGVYEQQGRVRLDANLNELVDLLDRRLRSTSSDTLGPAVVPAQTPDAFKLAMGAGGLTFGPGRAYIDGIQVDNHGAGIPLPPLHFDAHLEELRGTDQLPYSPQTYQPSPPALPAGGTHLVYLDVWHRERTWAEDPGLLDPALYGVDTAVRRQVVWQVRVHADDTPGVQCDTPDGQIAGWPDVVRPCASRLTTAAVGVPAAQDPCDVPPIGGFRGRSNRLYCVEIHDGGSMAVATFKWSRDNGSLASPVTAIAGADLSVVRPGRDAELRFAVGDHVEVTDDIHELDGAPGEMAVVAGVDDVRGTVTLQAPLTDVFDVAHNARVRRWDQSGSQVTAGGVIPVAASPIVIEDGVELRFSLDAEIAGGQFRSNERWSFRARVADGSVEILDHAPPRTPHHHIARLGVVDFTNGTVLSDCRVPWPGTCACDDEGCDCDVCVTADSHNSGALTIQDAVDRVRHRGGVVCLQPGTYVLRESVHIAQSNAVRVRGKGWTTVILTPGEQPAFVVDRSRQVTIEELTVLGSEERPREFERRGVLDGLAGNVAIAVRNTIGFAVQRCSLIVHPFRAKLPALLLVGVIAGLRVRDCQILGSTAIGNAPIDDDSTTGRMSKTETRTPGRLLLAHSRIEDNLLVGARTGIAFLGTAIHAGDNVVADNVVAGVIAGIAHMGTSAVGATVVRANLVAGSFYGIVNGLNLIRITDNEIFGLTTQLDGIDIPEPIRPQGDPTNPDPCAPDGVVYDAGPTGVVTSVGGLRGSIGLPAAIFVTDGLGFGARIESVRVEGNEIVEFLGHGILLLAATRTAMVRANRIARVSLDGIAVVGNRGGTATITDNVVRSVGVESSKQRHSPIADRHVLAGIAVGPVRDADVRGNQVLGVRSLYAERTAGIWIEGARNSQVAVNTVNDVGTDETSLGIVVHGPFDRTDVTDNRVRQRADGDPPPSRYTGVLIIGTARRLETHGAGYLAMGLKFVRYLRPAEHGIWALLEGRIVKLALGREQGAVHGNTVDGAGLRSIVEVIVAGNALVNDNRVTFVPSEDIPAVQISADSAVVSANYIETRPAAPAVAISADPAKVAITTNVTNGTLRINSQLLTPAWRAVNVATP